MQTRIEVVQFLFVYCLTSVFTDYLLNFPYTAVIFTQKERIVDTQVNPIQLAYYHTIL